jgi:hypothetical protein
LNIKGFAFIFSLIEYTIPVLSYIDKANPVTASVNIKFTDSSFTFSAVT